MDEGHAMSEMQVALDDFSMMTVLENLMMKLRGQVRLAMACIITY